MNENENDKEKNQTKNTATKARKQMTAIKIAKGPDR